jgi:hypothetical protein
MFESERGVGDGSIEEVGREVEHDAACSEAEHACVHVRDCDCGAGGRWENEEEENGGEKMGEENEQACVCRVEPAVYAGMVGYAAEIAYYGVSACVATAYAATAYGAQTALSQATGHVGYVCAKEKGCAKATGCVTETEYDERFE